MKPRESIAQAIILSLLCWIGSATLMAQGDFNLLYRYGYGPQTELYFHPENDPIGYISSGANLVVADFTDPLNPVEINKIEVSKNIEHFVLVDQYLYLVDQDILWIYSVSNATDPQFINSVVLAESARLIFHDQDRLYLLSREYLYVHDISDKKSPTFLTRINAGDYLFDLAFNGPFIFGSTQHRSKNWMVLIDISDLENSKSSHIQFSENYVNTVEMVDDYLYVGVKDSLYIFNIDNPGEPFLEKTVFTDWIYDIGLQSEFAFFSSQGNGVDIYNVLDPLNPTYVSDLRVWSDGMRFNPPFAFTFTGDGFIGVHNISDINHPLRNVSQITFGGRNYDIEIFDNYVYLAQPPQLVILDFNNLEQPKITSLPIEDIQDLQLDDSYLYAAQDGEGWSIVDISNKTNPVVISQLDRDKRIREIKVSQEYAFLANEREGVLIYDISDPMQPVEKGSYVMEGECWKIILIDNYIYAFEEGFGLRIVDISDKANPQLVESLPLTRRIEVMLAHDSLLYLGMRTDSRIMNISDPAHPLDLGISIDWTSPYDLFIQSDTLYLADWRDGLFIYDLSNPLNPKRIGQYTQTIRANAVSVDGRKIYLLDLLNGIHVLQYNISTTAIKRSIKNTQQIFSLYPNPARDHLNIHFSSRRPSNETFLTIYNTQGEILSDRKYPLKNGNLQVNISDWPSGMYYMIIRSGDMRQTQKFIRIR